MSPQRQERSVDIGRLKAESSSLEQRFSKLKDAGLKLDMTRGKPSPQQLDLANPLATILTAEDYRAADGTDCRNYGGVDGLPEAKTIMAGLLDVRSEERRVGKECR